MLSYYRIKQQKLRLMSCGINIARTCMVKTFKPESIWIDLESTVWTGACAELTQRTFWGSTVNLQFLIDAQHFQTRNRLIVFTHYSQSVSGLKMPWIDEKLLADGRSPKSALGRFSPGTCSCGSFEIYSNGIKWNVLIIWCSSNIHSTAHTSKFLLFDMVIR